MKKILTLCLFFASLIIKSQIIFSQIEANELLSTKNDPKALVYEPYIISHHGGNFDINRFKKENSIQYSKELWYFSRSFLIKRNHFNSGYELSESIIDISRFESNRKEDSESTVIIDGFKDVIVLLPNNKLIYKP
jgi:hypothetical protein